MRLFRRRSPGQEEALRRIRQARQTGAPMLDLSGLELTTLPAEIGQLTNLEFLNLRSNKLTELPAEIGRLPNLQVLDAGLGLHGRLTTLPAEIGQLANLRVLALQMHKLTRLPAEIGQLRNLRTLNLYGNQLTELPAEIFHLRNLEHLQLWDNPLVELPSQIGQLTNLRELAVGRAPATKSSKELTELPPEIGQLTKLEVLKLTQNALARLPPELGQLINLRTLELANNRLTELPAEIDQLSNLEKLDLYGNKLTEVPAVVGQLRNLRRLRLGMIVRWSDEKDLGGLANLQALTNLEQLDLDGNLLARFPSELCQLTNLRELDLSGNRLTELPAELGQLTSLEKLNLRGNRLAELPTELGQLTDLQELDLGGNPLAAPLSELAEPGTEAVLAYLRSLIDAEALYEAKLLLVGEGRAGKTTLIARLRGEKFQPDRPFTHGIELGQLRIAHPAERATMTLHTWDFGGQDVYQPTHQLFLTPNALYLLVWNPGQDSPAQVEAWLRRVRRYVKEQARVLLVATHADQHPPVLDYPALQERFGGLLAAAVAVDSRSGAGLPALRSAIAEQAAKLPQMGEQLGRNWVRARDQLIAQPTPQLPYQDYLKVCTDQEVPQDQADALLRLLHMRGQLIYYADDPWLRDLVVLQPEWLTKAISYILDDPATKNAGGVLEHAHLRELWQPYYPAELHDYLLRLMERFDVSYQLGDAPGERHLVGQLVPAARPPPKAFPQRQRRGEQVVKRRYVLEEEPPGLMAWLIVRTRHHATDWYWQRGVVLEHPKSRSRALLELRDPDPDGQPTAGPTLALTVYAPAPDYLLHVLSDTVEALLRHRQPGLGYQLRVPCRFRCRGWFALETLRQHHDSGIHTVTCKACGRTQTTGLLLTGVPSPPRCGRAAEGATDLWRDEQLFDLEERIVGRIGRRLRETEEKLAAHIAQVAETLRTQLREWTRQYEESTGCPRLFTLTPLAKHGLGKLAVGRDAYELVLWCEHLDQPHPWPHARYEVHQTADWLAGFAPHALRVLGLLRLALLLAVPGVTLAGGADYKAVVERLEAMGKLLNLLPDRMSDQPADPGLTSGPEPAEGAGLRALRALLDAVDPHRGYGGLDVGRTAAKDTLWVCPQHRRHYS
jgi:internalin A